MNIWLICEVATAAVLLSGAAPTRAQTATGGQARLPYSLTISTSRSEFAVGADIKVDIDTKNISDAPLPIVAEFGGSQDVIDIDYRIFVTDENGNTPPETKHGRRVRTGKDDPGETTVFVGKTMTRSLPPGGTQREQVILNRLYDMSKPGQYSVQLRFIGDTDALVMSNRITIKVVADPKNQPSLKK